jgi:hypothetical protein
VLWVSSVRRPRTCKNWSNPREKREKEKRERERKPLADKENLPATEVVSWLLWSLRRASEERSQDHILPSLNPAWSDVCRLCSERTQTGGDSEVCEDCAVHHTTKFRSLHDNDFITFINPSIIHQIIHQIILYQIIITFISPVIHQIIHQSSLIDSFIDSFINHSSIIHQSFINHSSIIHQIIHNILQSFIKVFIGHHSSNHSSIIHQSFIIHQSWCKCAQTAWLVTPDDLFANVGQGHR